MEGFKYSPSSSTRSSSSSVRNPYDYSPMSFIPAKQSSSDLGYEFVGVKCKCDLPAPCQEAWKEGTLDQGKRFFGCSQFKDPRKKCNFFLRADPSYPKRARGVIKELKMKLKRKDDELHNANVDMNFLEKKMLVLNEEVVLLRKQNVEANYMMRKLEKKAGTFKRLLVVAIVVMMIMYILN